MGRDDQWKGSYDAWKLMSPEDDSALCPHCGAYSPSQCELEDETGVCIWEEAQPDPDLQREDRDERQRLEREGE